MSPRLTDDEWWTRLRAVEALVAAERWPSPQVATERALYFWIRRAIQHPPEGDKGEAIKRLAQHRPPLAPIPAGVERSPQGKILGRKRGRPPGMPVTYSAEVIARRAERWWARYREVEEIIGTTGLMPTTENRAIYQWLITQRARIDTLPADQADAIRVLDAVPRKKRRRRQPAPVLEGTGGEHRTRPSQPRGECNAPGCDRPAVARGFCMMHYKRARAGRPLIDREVGSPSGFGLYGVLDVDEDSVLCHECGERFASVGAHLAKAHGMTAAEYKKTHGLPRTISLISQSLSRSHSETSQARIGSAGWQRLEQARDPVAASHSRTEEAFEAVSIAARRDPARARQAGKTTRKARVVTCPVCATEWCPLPGGYGRITCSKACWETLVSWIRLAAPKANAARDAEILAAYDDGMTYAELSRRHGITRERIGQIIRRHQTA